MSGIEIIAATLMAYAAWSTGLPNPGKLPVIQEMTLCEIANDYNRVPLETPCEEKSSGSFIGASYSLADGILRYPKEIPVTSIRGKSFLLHELTHYVQHMALRARHPIMVEAFMSQPCFAGKFEPMAYGVQFEWLREQGADPFATIPIDQTFLTLVTTCRHDVADVDG